MATTIEIQELSQRWNEVLETVRAGQEVVILNHTVPQARLLPMQPRRAGLHAGVIQTPPDFDEALPDAFWVGER